MTSDLRNMMSEIFKKVMEDNATNISNIESELDFRVSRYLSDEQFKVIREKNDEGQEVIHLYYLDSPPDGIPQIIEIRGTIF